MKILFAAPENAWGSTLALLKNALPEHDFTALGHFAPESLAGYDVLIPAMSRITDALLQTADRLRLIQQVGVGLEGVDIDAARKRGIRIANVPAERSGSADSVAELGIFMMIGLARQFQKMKESFSARRIGEPMGMALKGKTVGIVGLGGIGKALINRLKPFGMRLIGIKRQKTEQAARDLGLEWIGGPENLDHLLSQSDFVVLSLPVTDESRNMMNERTLAVMKPGSYIINLARGEIIDREALENALASGHLGGAGLDVYWEEPVDPEEPIFRYNVLTTPHIGASTDVAMTGTVAIMAENIRRAEKGIAPVYAR